jgi:hypothetical protein
MRGRRFATIALSLLLAGTAQAVSTSIPPVNQPLTGPSAGLEKLAQAYRNLSVAGIDAMLTRDYRFHAIGANAENLLRFTDGYTRENELESVRGMLEGVTRDGRVIMPKADSVGMSFDGILPGVDPEHPDSTQHYQVLTVTRAQFGIRLANGRHLTNQPCRHVFHVVRGDVALLAPGQPADPDRWYIRRWLEDVSGLRTALNEKRGDCGERDPGTGPAVASGRPPGPGLPRTLGIRALTNPACSALRVSCDLPGSEPARVEVYDVSGRLVNTRQLEVKAAGNLIVDAGAGAHLIPGVYWVRLGQAKRHPSTRMVVVAR